MKLQSVWTEIFKVIFLLFEDKKLFFEDDLWLELKKMGTLIPHTVDDHQACMFSVHSDFLQRFLLQGQISWKSAIDSKMKDNNKDILSSRIALYF